MGRMPSLPAAPSVLSGKRLELRAFSMEDAARVQELAGAREVASTTLTIPHPYEEGMAEEWIRTHGPAYAAGTLANFAVTERGELVGAIGLTMKLPHARAELGYWIGVPFWGQGYATEAGELVLRFGFETVGLNRIFAHHLSRNPASGRVLQKLGMRHEGTLRQHVRKWERFEDLELYGVLVSEWRSASAEAAH